MQNFVLTSRFVV